MTAIKWTNPYKGYSLEKRIETLEWFLDGMAMRIGNNLYTYEDILNMPIFPDKDSLADIPSPPDKLE